MIQSFSFRVSTAGAKRTNFTGPGTALSLGGRLLEDMCRYASLAISGSTRRTYSAGERRYLAFFAVCEWDPLPASGFMLSAFAAHLAGREKPGPSEHGSSTESPPRPRAA